MDALRDAMSRHPGRDISEYQMYITQECEKHRTKSIKQAEA